MSEQAVIVRFVATDANQSPHEIDNFMEEVFEEDPDIEYDGYEFDSASNRYEIFFYGKNADHLFSRLRPLLAKMGLSKRLEYTLRFGEPDDDCIERTEIVDAGS